MEFEQVMEKIASRTDLKAHQDAGHTIKHHSVRWSGCVTCSCWIDTRPIKVGAK